MSKFSPLRLSTLAHLPAISHIDTINLGKDDAKKSHAMRSRKMVPPMMLFQLLLLSANAQLSPEMQRLALKDHWEFYRRLETQNMRERAAQAPTSSGSTYSGSLYSTGRSKPYKYSKKELELLQKESELKAEAGDLKEIYRCIAYYENKGDASRVQYWTEKACERGDGYYCLELANQSRYSPEEYYKWLNKAYMLGVREVFDEMVSLTLQRDPKRAVSMMETRAAAEPAYYLTTAIECFRRGTNTYDSAKGIELLKKGAMKGDSSCSYWLRAFSNPQTAKIAAISMGMSITEENVNGNWIIARHFIDIYNHPDGLGKQYKFKPDIIYFIDGEQRYESKGTLFSISSTLFVENYKNIIDINGKEVRQTNYDRIDAPQGGFVPFIKNGLQGFMDTLANEVIPAEYYYASIGQDGRIQLSDGMMVKTRTGMQETRAELLTWTIQKNLSSYAADYFSNDQIPAFKLSIVKTAKKDLYKKKTGPDKYIVTPKANISGWQPGQPLGIMDAQGKWVVSLVSIPASSYYASSNDYFVFEKNGKLGVYSDDGDLWLDAQFDYVGYYDFFAKTFIVHKDGNAGLYRIGGEKLLDCAYHKIERSAKTIKGKSESGWTYENNRVKGFINEKGKILMEEKR